MGGHACEPTYVKKRGTCARHRRSSMEMMQQIEGMMQ
jgi:hypothetical protein